MNLGQAKAKLDSISKSTATKHPKVLISELCAVIKFLLDEVGYIEAPKASVFSQKLPEDIEFTKLPIPIKWPDHLKKKPPGHQPQSPKLNPPRIKEEGPRKFRSGNAGDAE